MHMCMCVFACLLVKRCCGSVRVRGNSMRSQDDKNVKGEVKALKKVISKGVFFARHFRFGHQECFFKLADI